MTFRGQLAEQVNINGGEYRGDLTKSVTHLIAYTADGKKYQYAQQWGIKIVSLKWFKDSLERGMVLDEEDYHPIILINEQGLKAWNREAKHKIQSLKRARQEEDVPIEPSRKLRRSASARIGSQTESLWEDIVGNSEKARDLRPSKSMSNVRPVILEAKSFATDTTDTGPQAKGRSSLRPPTGYEGFLQNTVFVLHGFNDRQTTILKEHLHSNGALIVENEWDLSSENSFSNFILVPYNRPRSVVPELESPARVVTNLWLEKCLMNKQLSEPGKHALDNPIHTLPIPGFEKLKINATAFEGIERAHVAKVVRSLGAIYDEFFKPDVSILVSNTDTPSEERLHHALEWKIPVVKADWLWACVKSGKLQPPKGYAIALPDHNEKPGQIRPKQEQQQDRPGSDFLEDAAKPKKVQKSAQSFRKENFDNFHTAAQEQPLKQISPNSPKKRSASPEKPKGMGGLDGAASSNDQRKQDTTSFKTAPEAESINDALEQLLNKQRTKPASNTMSTREENTLKKKRLFGRALSNLSNSSRDSSLMRPSRASSVDSMNTDGIGSIIGDDSGQPSRSGNESQHPQNRSVYNSFTGRASTKASLHSMHFDPSTDSSERRHLDDHEQPAEPQLTQLGYANPDDAVLLRELIIDKGVKKSEVDDKKDRRIRDDVAGTGWGAVKRTRTRTREVQGTDDGDDDLL